MTTDEMISLRISRYGRKKREAIYWVAANDDTATEDVDTIASYVSTILVADLWYRGSQDKAAADILFLRQRQEWL